jgi:micrococcal nuclease
MSPAAEEALSKVFHWLWSALWTAGLAYWFSFLESLKNQGGWQVVLAAVLTVAGKSLWETVKRYFVAAVLFLALVGATAPLPLVAAPPAHKELVVPKSFDGPVSHVIDGDTYWVELTPGTLVKVRLQFADAAETAHYAKQKDQPDGVEAMKFADKLLKGKTVHCEKKSESYGRPVVNMTVDGKDVALLLVKAGHAQVDPRYHPRKELRDAEAEAKKNKLGLWAADKPISPWDWRKKQREFERGFYFEHWTPKQRVREQSSEL